MITALVVFVAESKRGRRERRDEYRADVCALVAERTAALERELESMVEQGAASGARLYPLLREFSVGLDGQLPRARLAGLAAAVSQMTEVASSFLGRWHAAEGVGTGSRKARDLIVTGRIAEGASPQEATAEVDNEFGPLDDGRADQEALVRALGNYLSTLRHAIQDHARAKDFVPPATADWPALLSRAGNSGPGQARAQSFQDPNMEQSGVSEA